MLSTKIIGLCITALATVQVHAVDNVHTGVRVQIPERLLLAVGDQNLATTMVAFKHRARSIDPILKSGMQFKKDVSPNYNLKHGEYLLPPFQPGPEGLDLRPKLVEDLRLRITQRMRHHSQATPNLYRMEVNVDGNKRHVLMLTTGRSNDYFDEEVHLPQSELWFYESAKIPLLLAFDLSCFEELYYDVVVIASVDLKKDTGDVAKAWFSRRHEVLPALDEIMRSTCIAR
ncbi:uncharacterized protein UHOD_11486 [Ustilago sp. UG-2017b]|nr:uncharacterized protein UHOD_11486 [Ustilago sp. UG-2017b]